MLNGKTWFFNVSKVAYFNGPFCIQLHITYNSSFVVFKQKIVLCLKIRTEVVCIVMGDEDARAEIALKLILKAGNAKHFIPPLITIS